MSRLNSFIRRLEAQRACLNNAAQLIASVPGNVLEFGLGNGRTYDHLREQLRGRDIYVFERKVAAHPDCIPPDDRLFLGDFLDSLPKAIAQLGQSTALANLDIGSGDEAASKQLARAMLPFVLQLLKPGGILISDQPVERRGRSKRSRCPRASSRAATSCTAGAKSRQKLSSRASRAAARPGTHATCQRLGEMRMGPGSRCAWPSG